MKLCLWEQSGGHQKMVYKTTMYTTWVLMKVINIHHKPDWSWGLRNVWYSKMILSDPSNSAPDWNSDRMWWKLMAFIKTPLWTNQPLSISETFGVHFIFHPALTSSTFWWKPLTFIKTSPGFETGCFLMNALCTNHQGAVTLWDRSNWFYVSLPGFKSCSVNHFRNHFHSIIPIHPTTGPEFRSSRVDVVKFALGTVFVKMPFVHELPVQPYVVCSLNSWWSVHKIQDSWKPVSLNLELVNDEPLG